MDRIKLRCGDPIEIARDFQTEGSVYFEVPNDIGPSIYLGLSGAPASTGLKTLFRPGVLFSPGPLRETDHRLRRRCISSRHWPPMAPTAPFRLLKKGLGAARVIKRVHELDPEQPPVRVKPLL